MRAPFWPGLALLLGLATALRLALLHGPFGEIEADEAVVGLMARHLLAGEWSVFYWGQDYLGSLSALLTAPAFALFGATPLVLKLVPLGLSLGFLVLAALTARRAFGEGPALLTALYLAVPPAFLAIWSLKARGGYIELLVLGQGMLLLGLALARRDRWPLPGAFALGLLAGLALWTHPLAVVYLGPGLGLLLLRRGRTGPALLALLAGGLVGAAPLLLYNIAHPLATWQAVAGGSLRAEAVLEGLRWQVRYGLPVLAGLAQGSSSPGLFAADFATRPARWPGVALGLGLVALGVAGAFGRSLRAALTGRGTAGDLLAAQGLLLGGGLLLLASATRFGDLTIEPRYLLPLYATVPLGAALVWRLGRRWPALGGLLVALVLGINLWSLLTADPRLNLPDHLGPTDAASRRLLRTFLLAHGYRFVYTDYWLAYPLALESDEAIVPAVVAGGFNRYPPYVAAVARAPDPAFVFVAGSPTEERFRALLAASGAAARRETVAHFAVYTAIQPATALAHLRAQALAGL